MASPGKRWLHEQSRLSFLSWRSKRRATRPRVSVGRRGHVVDVRRAAKIQRSGPLTQLIIKQTVWGRLADVLIKITGSKERVQEHGRTIVARQIIKLLVAVAIFSLIRGAAQAGDDDEKGKDATTLR